MNYVPSNTNRTPGNNNNNSNSPIQTPPRSPSEASLASNRDIASDSVLSPLNSPVTLPPVPVSQQLPLTPIPRTLPPTPLAGLKAPQPTPPAAKQPPQPTIAANVALPLGQELLQLQQRYENLAESSRRHGFALQENAAAIRRLNEQSSEQTLLLRQLLERSDSEARTNRNVGTNNGSTSGSRSDNFPSEDNTNVRSFNNAGLNAQGRPNSEVRRVLEDKHIPSVITTIKSPVSDDIVGWIETLQSTARAMGWNDADLRQVLMFRTGGTLNKFLFRELDISNMTFTRIVNAIFSKWNNIDRLMINTQRLQNTRMIDGETVEAYYERFIDVAARVTNKSDFDKMITFIDGLSEQLREHMIKNSQPRDLETAYTAAQNAESWKSLFQKKPVTKKETIYQVIRPLTTTQRQYSPATTPGNFNSYNSGNFNTPRPFNQRPFSPKTPQSTSPKTPVPSPTNAKFNSNNSAARRLNFNTPQHNNIEEVPAAEAAEAAEPQDEFNNVEEPYYVVDDNAPAPGNDLLEEQ